MHPQIRVAMSGTSPRLIRDTPVERTNSPANVTTCTNKLLFLSLSLYFAERPLNEYISHYETLSYDHKHLHASHSRAKRSVTKDHQVHLRFKAHGKDFNIRLRRDLSTFSDKLEVSIPLFYFFFH